MREKIKKKNAGKKRIKATMKNEIVKKFSMRFVFVLSPYIIDGEEGGGEGKSWARPIRRIY